VLLAWRYAPLSTSHNSDARVGCTAAGAVSGVYRVAGVRAAATTARRDAERDGAARVATHCALWQRARRAIHRTAESFAHETVTSRVVCACVRCVTTITTTTAHCSCLCLDSARRHQAAAAATALTAARLRTCWSSAARSHPTCSISSRGRTRAVCVCVCARIVHIYQASHSFGQRVAAANGECEVCRVR
jgi:hypothetical protein